MNATVITAVAIQQGDDLDNFPRVNLFLNPPLALDRMSVYVDGAFQEFFTVDLRGYLGKIYLMNIKTSYRKIKTSFHELNIATILMIIFVFTLFMQITILIFCVH